MVSADSLWQPQPEAAELIARLVEEACQASGFLSEFRERLLSETGTRLVDWLDHLSVPTGAEWDGRLLDEELASRGFVCEEQQGRTVWRQAGGLFPPVLTDQRERGVAIKVESVRDFLLAQQLRCPIAGSVQADMRMAVVNQEGGIQTSVVERWGNPGWESVELPEEFLAKRLDWFERLVLRPRDFADSQDGFAACAKLIQEGIEQWGVDRTCAWFFAAERAYWQSRNDSAQFQWLRQQRLGLGWANHDHHTYRSSRESFRSLVSCLEQLGFRRRERFYAGQEAGWGAQVLEQPAAGITVFADVDLSPEEIADDFASEGLGPAQRLGTVGLWCALHGEAFLQAGMHHLESQFDFSQAREQLATHGFDCMDPFTNFDYLKQCFTQGQRWPVAQSRVKPLVEKGLITPQEAERFVAHGAVGSHLEILQRDDGFKGFNQTGISQIILKTDPRQCEAPGKSEVV